MGWKKARNNFSINTLIVRAKNVGKKIVGKSAKNLFLYSHEYRDQKMGGKNSRNNLSRNTRIVQAKNVGKKSSEKSAKNVFLYSHEYRDQKMGGEKRAKQSFQKHTNSSNKKCWEKNRRKKCEKRYFILTRIS